MCINVLSAGSCRVLRCDVICERGQQWANSCERGRGRTQNAAKSQVNAAHREHTEQTFRRQIACAVIYPCGWRWQLPRRATVSPHRMQLGKHSCENEHRKIAKIARDLDAFLGGRTGKRPCERPRHSAVESRPFSQHHSRASHTWRCEGAARLASSTLLLGGEFAGRTRIALSVERVMIRWPFTRLDLREAVRYRLEVGGTIPIWRCCCCAWRCICPTLYRGLHPCRHGLLVLWRFRRWLGPGYCWGFSRPALLLLPCRCEGHLLALSRHSHRFFPGDGVSWRADGDTAAMVEVVRNTPRNEEGGQRGGEWRCLQSLRQPI